MATEAEVRPFRRDLDAAVRLYLQHWMCTSETGFLIHPKVPLNVDGLKVADIACGTGIWLIDLAKQVREGAQLDGFDISSAHFPPKDELPGNVRLQHLDMMQPIPDQLVGQYDIVHIGRIVLYIQNEDPSKLLTNFTSLLKPGGYLCWDELDLGAVNPKTSDSNVSHVHADKIEGFGRMWLTSQGITTRWIADMDNVFRSHGLEVLDFQRKTVSNSMARPWTLMQLMANRDFIENDIIPMCEAGKMPPGSPSADDWRDMSRNLILECQNGVKLITDIVYVVARKPTETN